MEDSKIVNEVIKRLILFTGCNYKTCKEAWIYKNYIFKDTVDYLNRFKNRG